MKRYIYILLSNFGVLTTVSEKLLCHKYRYLAVDFVFVVPTVKFPPSSYFVYFLLRAV